MCGYKKSNAFFLTEKGNMAESCSWLFVENIPLLFDKERVSRQLKVETWLDLTQLLNDIKNEDTDKKSLQRVMNYVV